jgi:hypothetical protein
MSGAMPTPSIAVPSGMRSTQREYQTFTATPGSANDLGLPLEPRVRAPTVVTCGSHFIICTKPSPLLTARGPIRQTTGSVYGFDDVQYVSHLLRRQPLGWPTVECREFNRGHNREDCHEQRS